MATRTTFTGTVLHDTWERGGITLAAGDLVTVDALPGESFEFRSHAVLPDGRTYVDVVGVDDKTYRSFRPDQVQPE